MTSGTGSGVPRAACDRSVSIGDEREPAMSCESTLAALRVAVALFVFGALFGQYVVLPVAAIPDWIGPLATSDR
jgi:hypothetical protein